MQGRVLVVVTGVDVCALFQQQLHAGILPITRCKVEGCSAFLVLGIFVLPSLYQLPQWLNLTCK